MVMMSNDPPFVAISVVTFWRSAFSSSTTQSSLIPVACSNLGDSFCMMIMSELFTVAMVSLVCAWARVVANSDSARATTERSFGTSGLLLELSFKVAAGMYVVCGLLIGTLALLCQILGTLKKLRANDAPSVRRQRH